MPGAWQQTRGAQVGSSAWPLARSGGFAPSRPRPAVMAPLCAAPCRGRCGSRPVPALFPPCSWAVPVLSPCSVPLPAAVCRSGGRRTTGPGPLRPDPGLPLRPAR